MGRYVGGIFGNTVPGNPPTGAGSAVWSMRDQNWFASENKWIATVTATGGNIDGLQPGNGYTYHVFTSPGTFTVSVAAVGEVDCLVVGGGGAGGRQHGGGGGSGAAVHWSNFPISAQGYPISIGEGGAQPQGPGFNVPGSPNTATAGGNTTISSPTATMILAAGGGAGGTWNAAPNLGPSGGSAGGGNMVGAPTIPTTTGLTTPGAPSTSPAPNATTDSGGKSYQTDGGTGQDGGGGGGGSGQAGNPTNPTQPGIGGNGQPFPGFAGPLFPSMPTDWKTAVGPTGHFAGGGGGGGHAGSCPTTPVGCGAPGGEGGGGNGGNYISPEPSSTDGDPGLANTGSGGGGGGSNDVSSGLGGDGVVIIRYPG